MKELDCRGLACPQPVLNTKDALETDPSGGPFQVIVDNPAARDNVSRFARSQGCQVEVADAGGDFILTLTRSGAASGPAPDRPGQPAVSPSLPRLVVKISSQFMGNGADDLGRVLMKAFIKSLSEATLRPEAVVFYNSGVHLTCEGSEHIEAIRVLEESGVRIFSCGTCLDFFRIKDKLAVGQVTNMFEIIETISGADRVVSP
ncbi:MAG: sulfurtransferase-like selenium metabolism protein YedF [Proteobacteria bacterium]|nr:sulfurtransferase-like selenium metabolism protein YedF [Pseudomonadota bacterium]